jgi:hypothetical protein
VIYFIQREDDPRSPVKIGFTARDPSIRLSSLQTGSPDRLKIIHTIQGSVNGERELHRKFAKNRTSGEWFSWSDEIACFIDSGEPADETEIEDEPSKKQKVVKIPQLSWDRSKEMVPKLDGKVIMACVETATTAAVIRLALVLGLEQLEKEHGPRG